MAAEGDLQEEVLSHRKGYDFFINLMKWGAVFGLVTALLVIFMIAK